MLTRMDSSNNLSLARRTLAVVLIVAALAPIGLLGGCTMTPEDKAFYGRGWVNPDELDYDNSTTPPAASHGDSTDIPNHMMGPGEY
jgi:hypothetical protein